MKTKQNKTKQMNHKTHFDYTPNKTSRLITVLARKKLKACILLKYEASGVRSMAIHIEILRVLHNVWDIVSFLMNV